jgi:alanyl-tRNA synthetase
VKHAAEVVGGKGGGRPDLAMAGGPDVSRLDAAIAAAESWLSQQMA